MQAGWQEAISERSPLFLSPSEHLRAAADWTRGSGLGVPCLTPFVDQEVGTLGRRSPRALSPTQKASCEHLVFWDVPLPPACTAPLQLVPGGPFPALLRLAQ